jgi:hypothetical protein
LALIPIFSKNILEFYPGAEIPAKTYNWQPNPVSTVAVKAVLVSFDFRRSDCEYVGRFAEILANNIEWLKKNGHPKWQFVDLDFPLKGWEQYDCVRRFLPRAAPTVRGKTSTTNPVMDAIKDMLGE